MAVEVIVSPAAERDVRKLSQDGLRAAFKAMDLLSKNILPRGVEKIQGHPGFFRVRVGVFRIIYFPLAAQRVVILEIADRKDVYKKVANLEAKLAKAING